MNEPDKKDFTKQEEDPGDPLLMGDGLSIDHLASLGVRKSVTAALKANNINTYGQFRKWNENRINQQLKATIPIRGFAVNARKLIGSGRLKRSHDKLSKMMRELSDKKNAEAERERERERIADEVSRTKLRRARRTGEGRED